MKRLNTLTITCLLLFTVAQCSDDDANPRADKIYFLTTDVWVTENVINSADGDLTSMYQNFSIAFLKNADTTFDGDYFVSDGGRAFPNASGRWKLSGDLKSIQLSDGRTMTAEVTRDQLIVAIDVANSGGRTKGLSGRFTFTLKHRN